MTICYAFEQVVFAGDWRLINAYIITIIIITAIFSQILWYVSRYTVNMDH